MSVRVHAIAKEVNKSSKELIEILIERGYDIKSASASIDNITAQSIIDEFSVAVETDNTAKDSPVTEAQSPQEPKKEPAKKAPIVKSKADLEEEKRESQQKEKKKKKDKQKIKKATKKKERLRYCILIQTYYRHFMKKK